MRHGRPRLFAAFALAVCLAGCAHFTARRTTNATVHGSAALPAVDRGSVEANIHSLPSVPNRDVTASPDPFPVPPYRALTAYQCQCLAASAAATADLHQQEATLDSRRALKTGNTAELRRNILRLTALEIQNRSAGAALEAYYRLAEAEGKSDLLTEGLGHLHHAYRETRDMVAQKLKPVVALDVWTRQLLSAQSDRLQAQMTITQLNAELRRMLDLATGGDDWRIWNPEGYQVVDQAIDAEAAVHEGLAQRTELQLLRLVLRELDADTLPAVRDVLRAVQPLLGASRGAGPHPLTKVVSILALKRAERNEVAVRRQQVQEHLTEREAAVAEEIRAAAATVVYRGRLAGLAWERERSWDEKVREVRSRQQQGLASFVEVTQTNLDWLKARADVIQEVMAWQIARVKLRQAQGLLPAECADSYCR